jgi:hypothetical protein
MRSKKPDPGDTAAEVASDTKRGITQGSAADKRMDAMEANQNRPPPKMQMQTANSGAMPPDAHHVAAATSIAHAILGRRSGGM